MVYNGIMNKETAIKKQGEFGERLVQKMFKEKYSLNVIKNPDEFGRWDMFVYNDDHSFARTVQVKTVARYCAKNYFALHGGVTGRAIQTMITADSLILVCRNPWGFTDYEYGGKILEVVDHEGYKVNIKGEYVIPSTPNCLTVLDELDPNVLKELDAFDTRKRR
jgi:hypothetical protein